LPPENVLALTHASAIGRALAAYAQLLAWPVDLQIDRLTPSTGSSAGDAAAVALLLIIGAAAVWGLAQRGMVADWTAWILAFYLPVANIVALYPSIADHWLFTPEHNFYAPLAGMAVLATLALERGVLQRRAPWRSLALAAAGAIVVVWSARTVLRTFDWRDEPRLFRNAAVSGSASPRVWFNYGNVLFRDGTVTEAVAAYRRALQLAPHDAEAWINLGVALQRQDQLADAIAAYRRAETLAPPSALLLENLGTALLARGEIGAARAAFTKALALDPQRRTARAAVQAIDRRR
jgi:tetratricopeptide (TPR) repeat protein